MTLRKRLLQDAGLLLAGVVIGRVLIQLGVIG